MHPEPEPQKCIKCGHWEIKHKIVLILKGDVGITVPQVRCMGVYNSRTTKNKDEYIVCACKGFEE